MKWMIASDLHGSARCCRALLEALDREGADRLVLLGDLLYHGPRNDFPEEYDTRAVTALLNSVKNRLLCVRGNCDSEVDQMISNFPIIGDFSMEWQGHTLYFTHGHKCNPELPPTGAKRGDVVFYGHFHKAALTEKDGVRYVCVGALGLSPEGVERSYAVIDETSVTVKALERDDTILKFDI